MRRRILESSVATLINKGIIDSSDRELYIFGINQLFLFVVNIITSIIIGIIYGMLLQSIVFSLAYIPLRRYAGGYHSKTPARCYVLSILLVLCALTVIKTISIDNIVLTICALIAAIVVFTKAPIESSNKPLNDNEKKVFALKARLVLAVEILLIVIFGILSIEVNFAAEIAVCGIIAICCSGFMILISILQSAIQRNR